MAAQSRTGAFYYIAKARRSGGQGAFLFLTAFLLLGVSILAAQTLEQAEKLWKARDYQGANEVFKQLVARYPENPNYRVQWGRLFLDHGQSKEVPIADGLFNEALKIDPQNGGALLGKALIAAEEYGGNAAELARKALEADPKLGEAQDLLARLALEDGNRPKAAEEARKGLALDPNSPRAKAVLASIDWLSDKKESEWDPHDARGYELAAHFFIINRRYEEAIELYRKAVALDPQLYSALSQLGVTLMRVGRSEEAFKDLETCYNNGFQDDATVNSLRLLDSNKNYVEFTTPETILKVSRKEAGVLRPYFEPEMQRAIATYEKKYRFKLGSPVAVQVYPNHDDFAVRTAGLPGLGGILGVTFGYAIGMDSPSGRPPGSFHWDSTMWHELSHVFTLTMTNFHVPRWFTEGLAVHEETAASPEWGDRLGPEEIAAIKNHKLLPVAELDRGFVHPTNPAQVVISYFQAGKICDYITDKFGWDAILAMLHDYGAGEDTPTVVRKELKMEPADFDKQFFASIDAEYKRVVDNFDTWKAAMKKIDEMRKAKDWDGIIREGTAARDLYPDFVEGGSMYESLAKAYQEKGDKAAAAAQLERYVHVGGRNPESIKQLAGLLTDAGKKKEAAEVLERLNYIYPMDPDQHQKLGELWLSLGNAPGAIREFQVLLARNPQDAAQAHFDLANAYKLNHQPAPARDEAVAALEIAPGFRSAQKLLLELSGEENGTAPVPVKK